MKIATPILLLLVVSLMFVSVALLVEDMSKGYPAVANVTTEYKTQFDYSSQIGANMTKLQEDITKVSEEEAGWKKILGGLLVFPKVFITAILVILSLVIFAPAVITDIGTALHVPAPIFAIFITMVIVAIIFMIIKFLNKQPVGT